MRIRPINLTALCVAAALVAGCSGGGGGAKGAATPAGPPGVMVAGIEQLASKSGCRLQSQTKAVEVTQGACKTAKGRFTLVTFNSDQGQQSWLTEAKNWGGDYLVGPRWVAVSVPPTLAALRQEIGGDLQAGRKH